MYCSVIMSGIFSFISKSNLNNVRKLFYYFYNVYVIKKK